MKKKVILALGLAFSFIILASIIAYGAFEDVPPVGESGCVTYAQARAQGISGTDAQLHSMGFCSGGEESTTSETTTTQDYEGESYDQLQQIWDDNQCRWGGTSQFSEAQCDQLELAMEQAQAENTPTKETSTEETSSDEVPNPKSIGEFSNEELNQQMTDGNQLISDVDIIKQLVSDKIISAIGKYSSEVYQQASKIQDDADKISSDEYTAAQTDANNLGAQMDDCDQCWQSEPDSEGCQCRDSIQLQINIGSYNHFMKSFKAQQAALDQITNLLETSEPISEETTTSENTDTSNHGTIIGGQQLNIADYVPLVPGRVLSDYYGQTIVFVTPDEEAKMKLDATRPMGLEVVNAKGNYEDALRKGASDEELARLKDDFDAKKIALAQKIYDDVLSRDPTNSEALWQMGTLAKWNDQNKVSYEYYREALLQAKTNNPFEYQRLIDSIKNPAMQMYLVQSLEPDEKIITLPTTETSPMLRKFKKDFDDFVAPVDEKIRSYAKDIEKVSMVFSVSDQLTATENDLGFSPIGVGGENE